MRIVCGLDVHKDSVFACLLNENGDKIECKFGVLTPELEELHQLLLTHEVREVTMESTSIYWHPIWRVLDDIEDLKLVNPYFIKQLPGRKSDVRDAAWIAECTMGPRQITGASGSTKKPIDITFMPCTTGGTIKPASFVSGRARWASMRGCDAP